MLPNRQVNSDRLHLAERTRTIKANPPAQHLLSKGRVVVFAGKENTLEKEMVIIKLKGAFNQRKWKWWGQYKLAAFHARRLRR